STKQAVGCRDSFETPIEQREWNSSLLLHASGERGKGGRGRTDVNDEIGLERQHGFEVCGVAPARETADFRTFAYAGKQESAFLNPIRAWPAKQEVGRQRIEEYCSRWASRKYPRNRLRNLDEPPCGIRDAVGSRSVRSEQHCGGSQKRASVNAH